MSDMPCKHPTPETGTIADLMSGNSETIERALNALCDIHPAWQKAMQAPSMQAASAGNADLRGLPTAFPTPSVPK